MSARRGDRLGCLWIVTGKGGTGKTTLAAMLALLAARAGLRTLYVQASGEERLPELLGVAADARDGSEVVPASPGLSALLLRPEDALEEYVDLQLRMSGAGRRLLRSRAARTFLEAAPAWRDLVRLGKLWHLEQEMRAGRAPFDRMVVDGPATGHALDLLRAPRQVMAAVRAGPVQRRAAAIHDLLVDRARTRCVLVSLAEELPVSETLELARAVRSLGMALGPVLLNRIEAGPRIPLDRVRAGLARLGSEGAPPLVEPTALGSVLGLWSERCEREQRWRARLEKELALPVEAVPELPEAPATRAGLERLADEAGPGLLGAIA